MNARQYFCQYCGTALEPGNRFCENCGKPVAAAPPPPPVQSPAPRAPIQPPSPALAPPKRRFPTWVIVLGVGSILMVCAIIVVAGGLWFMGDRDTGRPAADEPVPATAVAYPTSAPAPTGIPPTIQIDLPTPTEAPVEPTSEPTSEPAPTNAPPPPEPTSPPPGDALTGDQQIDDYSIFDDFSSSALGWLEEQNSISSLRIENGAYAIQVTDPGNYAYSPLPVAFNPYEIQFDAKGPGGNIQYGTFGVICQYQDPDNYYYVEFDLNLNSYTFAARMAGELVPLNEPAWQESADLKISPGEVNHIWISCYPDLIGLFINNEFVDETWVTDPFTTSGDMTLFVYAWDYALEEGYTVIFDNVEAWEPVQ